MLVSKIYDRERAVLYARKWALSRNPLFTDYTGIGGNCTNFVSQCLYAGSCVMNFTPVFGWYYLSDRERTASWTGVPYFYDFLTGNEGEGPYGKKIGEESLLPGDVIQLGREEDGYYHTLFCLGRRGGVTYVAAQSDDALERPLHTYTYDYARYLQVEGVRMTVPDFSDCFEALYQGEQLVINSLPDPLTPPERPLPPPPPEEPTRQEEM